MTRKAIAKALLFWKSVLRLEDWMIDVKTVPGLKKGGDKLEGYNLIDHENMFSSIELNWGASEETLVHELLHLVHDGDAPKESYDLLHERALNRVAAALLHLKEGKDGRS